MTLYQNYSNYFDWLKNMASTGGVAIFYYVNIGKTFMKPQGLVRETTLAVMVAFDLPVVCSCYIGKTLKKILSETTRSRALIFGI